MSPADLSVVRDEHSQVPSARDRGYLSSQDVMARMTRILEIQKSVMKEKVHFGTIPGTPKPTLYKAGAEKLLTTFQIAAVVKEVIDLSTADEVRYRVLVQGVGQASGIVLGEAWGECSSNEEKYRWRKPVCDAEFQDAPEDLRRMVWKKYGGEPFKAKQVRTSPPDVANTILQMATKRGLVPMTRVVLACSDIFDQDLEDMPEELRESILEHEGQVEKPAMQPPQRKSQGPQTAAPSVQLPLGAVLVTKTDAKHGESNGQKWKLYLVTFSDGKTAATFDVDIAAYAEKARMDKRPVWPQLEDGKGPGKYKLNEFSELDQAPAPEQQAPATTQDATPATDPGLPLSAEDIPWN